MLRYIHHSAFIIQKITLRYSSFIIKKYSSLEITAIFDDIRRFHAAFDHFTDFFFFE
jgi:hypothetical protein